MTDSEDVPPLSRALSRQVDSAAISELSIDSLVLMENAARGVVSELRRIPVPSHSVIQIVCGPGNNGGDGLAVARLLLAEPLSSAPEIRVCLVTAGRDLTSDTLANLLVLRASGCPVTISESGEETADEVRCLKASDTLIDCLLGTGVRGLVRSPFDGIITAVNQSSAFVLAVDVPSGLDCDTGSPCGVAVRADLTVTFVALKQGFLSESGRAHTGRVVCRQIGIPLSWLRQFAVHSLSSSDDRLRHHG